MTNIRSPETLAEFCARTRSFNQTSLPGSGKLPPSDAVL